MVACTSSHQADFSSQICAHSPGVKGVCAGVVFIGWFKRNFAFQVIEEDTLQRNLPYQLNTNTPTQSGHFNVAMIAPHTCTLHHTSTTNRKLSSQNPE